MAPLPLLDVPLGEPQLALLPTSVMVGDDRTRRRASDEDVADEQVVHDTVALAKRDPALEASAPTEVQRAG